MEAPRGVYVIALALAWRSTNCKENDCTHPSRVGKGDSTADWESLSAPYSQPVLYRRRLVTSARQPSLVTRSLKSEDGKTLSSQQHAHKKDGVEGRPYGVNVD